MHCVTAISLQFSRIMPCTCRSFGGKSFGAVGLHVWMDGMVWHEICNRNYYSTTATTTYYCYYYDHHCTTPNFMDLFINCCEQLLPPFYGHYTGQPAL